MAEGQERLAWAIHESPAHVALTCKVGRADVVIGPYENRFEYDKASPWGEAVTEGD